MILAFNLHVRSQSHQINGMIYDLQGRQSLSGVSISTADGQSTTLSDEQGAFTFTTQKARGVLRVSMLGYKTREVEFTSGQTLNIQLEPSTVSLNEVRVSAYNGNKTRKETAGSVALVTGDQIRSGNGVSLQSAFNHVPGVRMDQSTLSEARISIRGNGVRSAFGIRNVKIYLNDIPVTEPDGTTRIESLDVNNIGQAEIIKGPASSIYGGGTGGVINFRLQRSPYQEQSIEASGLAGSYGLVRLATTYRHGGDKVNSYASYGWQQFDGFRLHSKDMRRFLSGNFQFFPSDRQSITFLVSRSTQHAQIPGSLSAAQVEADPTQANLSNLDKQAGRYQNWTRIGVGQQYRLSDKLSNASSVFTYFYDLDHPLPFAYLRSYYQSFGGRTRFQYTPGFDSFPTTFTVGLEFNQANSRGTRYVNNQGREGQLTSDTDIENRVYSLFYQSETAIGPNTHLAFGLSYNGLNYDVRDYLYPEQSGVKKFKAQASPRLALSHHFSEALSLHGSVSSGFSPPSGAEIRNIDGSINRDLQAEKAVNYEINAKGNLLRSRLAYDLALYRMDMTGELIAQSVAQGITIYNNSGETSRNGLELALSYLAIDEAAGLPVTLLRPFASVAYSDFTFEDYKIRDASGAINSVYDGNQLTGIAPWVVSAGLQMETRMGVYFSGSYFFNDRLPLNDANSDFHDSYQIFDAKLGLKRNISRFFAVDVYTGLNNIGNERYSSITSLNAVAFGNGTPPYFNPSPERNFYAGLNIKYLLNRSLTNR